MARRLAHKLFLAGLNRPVLIKGASFICPNGEMYLQIDSVAMGSPHDPLFAKFYMGNIEETFKNIIKTEYTVDM
ncbi:hypothetical protein SK128_021278 [Halocaridina rubra]|uniref:Reverse transcriptase domain-containing protein n=1 Tax=Halocaridina rubra TaxID=373956 RepID=A0AAN9A2K8_HALRR